MTMLLSNVSGLTHLRVTPHNTTTRRDVDLYPPDLRSTIDELNAWVYEKINNGVYRVRTRVCARFYLQPPRSHLSPNTHT